MEEHGPVLNNDIIRMRRKRRRDFLRDYIQEYKQGKMCVECGNKNHFVLTFHHKDPTIKIADINHLVRARVTLTTLKSEIEKCDLLCLFCHHKIHNRLSRNKRKMFEVARFSHAADSSKETVPIKTSSDV